MASWRWPRLPHLAVHLIAIAEPVERDPRERPAKGSLMTNKNEDELSAMTSGSEKYLEAAEAGIEDLHRGGHPVQAAAAFLERERPAELAADAKGQLGLNLRDGCSEAAAESPVAGSASCR